MGRTAELDIDKLVELGYRNIKQSVMAEELGISIPTLARRLAEIRDKQGILMRYRELQSLQLTSIQAKILEHITPEKIAEAPLRDLVLAFKILKDKEQVIEGKPSEIKGLVGYLIELEKKEVAKEAEQFTDAEFEEASLAAGKAAGGEVLDVSSPDYIPSL
jgi:DNA-binding Lrp family transcriptional regulator